MTDEDTGRRIPPSLSEEEGPSKEGRPSEEARPFPSAEEDRLHTALDPKTEQTLSPAYKLGFADPDFLLRDELRASRLQLEFLKPDILLRDRGIAATVVMFGSSRIPAPAEAEARLAQARAALVADPENPRAVQHERAVRALAEKTRYYEEAQRLARMISEFERHPVPDDACRLQHGPTSVVVVTGGGPGIMEAANRGAHDVGADSVGLNIVLPFEQWPNEYITPHLCFNFHYFALRKMHFLIRALALVVFPGGFGTMDELFEVLTLIQTGKIRPIPVLLFGRSYWERIINFPGLVEEGVCSPKDLTIFSYVETAEEAWCILEPVVSRKA
ncbi:MAG TPA: LOG family protein [Thermoleophilia bacterium]|nr:LOG family protein [Thermoleophilia bacterium]